MQGYNKPEMNFLTLLLKAVFDKLKSKTFLFVTPSGFKPETF